ncbi:MAG: hypothetical protein ACM3S1_03910 [Hyphomicrobiales bacterium]
MLPRKLVETFFRRLWLLAIPVVLVPTLILLAVDHPVRYESSARVWVSNLAGVDQFTATSTNSEKTVSELQVELLSDLLATDSFRQEVAVAAGLVPAGALPADLASAAATVGGAVSIGSVGPNLFGLTATSADPVAAQRIATAVLDRYQERVRSEADRQATVVLQYFDSQIAAANDELARLRAEVTSYIAAHPTPAAGTPTVPDPELLRLQGEVDGQVKLIDRLNASRQDAQLSAASAPNSQLATFSVQDAPRLPQAPVPPSLMSRLMLPAAGAFLGLCIAAAYLYFCYRTDHSIRSAADVGGLPVAVLGYVPELRSSRGARLARLRQRLLRRDNRKPVVIQPTITVVHDSPGGGK